VMSCPEWIAPHFRILYDWLAANGIDEWIPEDPLIQVVGGEIRYQSFVWDGARGWDIDSIVVDDYGPLFEERRVPLVRPADDLVLAAAHEGGAVVVVGDDDE
jgi:hypothetical protein